LLQLHDGEGSLGVVVFQNALVVVEQRELRVGVDLEGIGTTSDEITTKDMTYDASQDVKKKGEGRIDT
jgi:hypothetical protein